MEVFHGDEGLDPVEVEDFRYRSRVAVRLPDQRMVFEERAVERKRPALADKTHVGEGLLDDHAPRVSRHDEDEVEVPVPHFADRPLLRRATDTLGDLRHRAQPLRERLDGQRLVRVIRQSAPSPSTSRRADPAPTRLAAPSFLPVPVHSSPHIFPILCCGRRPRSGGGAYSLKPLHQRECALSVRSPCHLGVSTPSRRRRAKCAGYPRRAAPDGRGTVPPGPRPSVRGPHPRRLAIDWRRCRTRGSDGRDVSH